MNRQQKEAIIADFKNMLTTAPGSFLVVYRGLNVKDVTTLRGMLREKGGQLKITKARLMKRAAEGIDGIDSFKENFKDQIGIVFAKEEVPPVAKQLIEFSKDHKALQILAGFFESKTLTRDEVEFFASLPSREVLFAQLAGALQSPASNLARAIAAPMQQLAYGLKQLAEKKGT